MKNAYGSNGKIRRYRSGQEIFNEVWRIWTGPNRPKRATGRGGYCTYHPDANGGFGCVVGSLLPPATAKSWAERDFSTIGMVAERYPQTYRRHFRKADLLLLQRFQDWHDSASAFGLAAEGLRQIANDFNLTIPDDADKAVAG